MVPDCVVVGAGPAGLAAGAELTGRGIDHVVVERARVDESWRTQRWDSLRVNNPGFMNLMLGEQKPNTYLTAGEVVERLEVLASTAPLRTGVTVHGLTRAGERWILGTSDGPIEARSVVVSSGGGRMFAAPRNGRPCCPTGSYSVMRRPTRIPVICRAGPFWPSGAPRGSRCDGPGTGTGTGTWETTPRTGATAGTVARRAEIGSVIWCTGYAGDFHWLGEDLTDPHGLPLRRGPASPAPGVWFVGLRWLIRRSSGNFVGFPRDAAVIADALESYLGPSGSRSSSDSAA